MATSMRSVRRSSALFGLAAILAAGASLTAQTPASGTAATPPAKPISKKAALEAMPDEERKWLTEYVAPIIMPDEEKLFLELTEPHQREVFKEDFWQRRERQNLPPPMGPGYRQRYEELWHLAESEYDGWRQDAGRMVLRFGEPASILKFEGCEATFMALELWIYPNFAGRQSTAPAWTARARTCSSSFERSSWKVGSRGSCPGPVSLASARRETLPLWNQKRRPCLGSCSRER